VILQDQSLVSETDKIPLPRWLPRSVAYRVGIIAANMIETDEQQAILARLTTDVRMRSVWQQFVRRNRNTGEFCYPAKPPPGWDYPATRPPWDDLTEGDGSLIVQAEALSELFNFAYCSARDKISTSTLDQAMERRREMINRATILRECAEMRRQDLIGDPQAVADAAAVDRVAKWLDAISKDIRSIGDPLSVQRQRGHPTVNGVAMSIGMWLSNRFGKRFDGIAATLASVAIGKPASPRAVRSALARTK
jgi:hypothetical protein